MEHIDPSSFNVLVEQVKQLTTALQGHQSFGYKWLPSIVGIIAALVAFIVGFLSFLSAKEQIKTSRQTAEAQIQSAAEIAKSQLENAKDITISQIKANLITASRKEWIENLRKNITELCALLNDIHTVEMDGCATAEDFKRMWQLSIYIELLLNSTEEEHLNFLKKKDAFIAFCVGGNANFDEWSDLKINYLSAASIILKSEWEKVKALS